MVPTKPKSSYRKSRNLKYRRRQIAHKFALKKPLKNMYVFKRLGQVIRIAHYNTAPTPQQFTVEDAGNQLISWGIGSVVAGKIDFAAESMPGTFQNGVAMAFRLSSLPSYTEFTPLFDRYKILGVKLTFMYQVNEFAAGGSPIAPTILYSSDNDDAIAPTYLGMRQRQNVKQKVLGISKPFSIYLRPSKVVATSSGSASTLNSLIDKKSWINTADSDVNHFGFKMWLNNVYSTAGSNLQLEIKPTYYLAFKDPQ